MRFANEVDDHRVRYARSGRERLVYSAGTGMLALATLIAAPLGAWNLLQALAFPERLTGAFMLLGALVTLLGGASTAVLAFGRGRSPITTRSRRKREYLLLTLVGAMTAFAMSGTMISIQLTVGDPRIIPLTISTSLAIASLLLAAHAFTARGPEFPFPRKVAAGAVVAALVAVGNFAYSQLYIPSKVEASVSHDIIFGDPVNEDDGEAVTVPFTVSLRLGPQAVYVLTAIYQATGRMARVEQDQRGHVALSEDLSQGYDPSATTDITGTEPIGTGKLIAPGQKLYPAEEVKIASFIRVPKPLQYDAIEMTVYLGLIAAERATLTEQEPEEGEDYVRREWRIKEASMLLESVRNPVNVSATWYYQPTPKGYRKPSFEFTFAHNSKQLNNPERYGGILSYERTLTPLTKIK